MGLVIPFKATEERNTATNSPYSHIVDKTLVVHQIEELLSRGCYPFEDELLDVLNNVKTLNSAMKYIDESFGLIQDQINDIITNESLAQDQQEKLIKELLPHMESLGKIANQFKDNAEEALSKFST